MPQEGGRALLQTVLSAPPDEGAHQEVGEPQSLTPPASPPQGDALQQREAALAAEATAVLDAAVIEGCMNCLVQPCDVQVQREP